ncbi:MAG: hypothetical protein IJC46_02950 [Clostridia bacterium]|nr:hypothetical protein [Clostridia bacterium]
MKRILCFVLLVVMLFCVVGCSSGEGDSEGASAGTAEPAEGDVGGVDVDANGVDANGVDASTGDGSVEYITERHVQYEEKQKEYILFFGFLNAAEEFVAASGTASVDIADCNGRSLYSANLQFSEEDFSTWENAVDGERYICALYIDASKFPHCDSDSGTLSFTIDLDDGTSFDVSELTVYDLPEHEWESATCTSPKKCKTCKATSGKANGHSYASDGTCYSCNAVNPTVQNALDSCSLKLPSLPCSLSSYGFRDNLEYTFSVTNIKYQFTVDNDGYAELTLWFSGIKDYDSDGSGQSDTCKIGYKIYDSNNNVVVSDTFYSPGLAMGEKFSDKEETAFWSSDKMRPGAYRLEILSTNQR